MKASSILVSLLPLAAVCLAGCTLPGRPKEGPEVPRPEEVTSFTKLYGDNCAGCHGAKGEGGSATNLANPEYQALIDDATLRDIIVKGEKGTLMPGFGVQSGGMLTDVQVDALVKGIRAQWSKGNVLAGLNAPPYKATHPGDISKGEAVYTAACASCHGTAQKPGKGGSILDGSFLALINEQTVRTTIIAGRPDIGEPDWRGHIPGRPMTDDEVTDVSAWLIAQRPATPGQPYPTAMSNGQPASPQQPAAKH